MKLHDAIVTVLLDQPENLATIDLIANEINLKNLYMRKDKQPLQSFQVRLRAKFCKGAYHHLFDWIEPNLVRLKK